MAARDALIEELRRHSLVIGEVVLTSGATAQYYVDAKRAILRPAGFRALAELVAERALGVDVVLRGGAARQDDLPDDDGVIAQFVDQPVARAHATRTLWPVPDGSPRGRT